MLYSQILRERIEAVLGDMLTEAASLQDIHTKYYPDISDKDFNAIVQADPTWKSDKPDKMGRFGKWLLNLYKKRYLKIEDLYKVKDDLTLFVKYYNRIEDKDINHYQDTHALTAAVEPFRTAQDNGEEMATSNSDEVRKAKSGARKIYEDGKWLILTPTTKEAAIYYGKNTKWCTAATSSNNMFARYNAQGPLYIVIDKARNTKYQFHFESAQYMDAMDKEIEQPVLETIGMSDSVARSAFGGDSLLLGKDYHGYEKLCNGCYVTSKAMFRYNGDGKPEVIYSDGGWALDAKWLGGRLAYANSKSGTVVVNIDSGQVLDKNTLGCVMAYGNGDGRVFVCQIKGSLSVCQVTSENRIKVLTNFRTTAIPDTLDGELDYLTDFPRYFVYNSGVLDARTRQSAFNVYDFSQCKIVLEDVVYTRDDQHDHWMSSDGKYYIGLRTAVDPDRYYDEDDMDDSGARYYRVYEDQTIEEDGDDSSMAESRSRVNEYLDKESGSPLLRAARKSGLEDTQVAKNRWAIHFTQPEIALDIMRNGFRKGLAKDDLNKGTMTMSSQGRHVEDGGYFYAYDVNDLQDANFGFLNEITSGHAVMFRVNGVKYFNEFDQDDQIMFADNAVRDKILLYRWGGSVAKGGLDNQVTNDDELWGVGCINGSPIYHSTLGNVIQWVMRHFDQYRKQLVGNTEIPQYGEYHEKSEEEYFSLTDLLPDNAANKYARWHNDQERADDVRQNEERFSQAAYQEFLKAKGIDLDKIKAEASQRLDSMEVPSENRQEILDRVVEFTLANLGADWNRFVEHQQNERPFYVRTRPDGDYWKWH